MKNGIAALVLLGFLSIFLPAQEGETDAKSAGQARFDELNEAWYAHIKAWWAEQRAAAAAAEEAGEPVPAMSMRPPFGDFIARFEKEAANHEGRDEAIPYLLWLVQNTLGEKSQAKHGQVAITTLLDAHMESEKIGELTEVLGYMGRAIGQKKALGYLKRIESESPHGDVKAKAIVGMHREAVESAPLDSKGYKVGRAEFLRASELATDAALKAEIQGAIDAREKLRVGKVAPDIEGVDLDGVAFKLSDYKGKIILLDFWGDW